MHPLERYRREHNMTRTDLWRALGGKISRSAIVLHETGRREISLKSGLIYTEGTELPLAELCPEYRRLLASGIDPIGQNPEGVRAEEGK